MKFIQHLIDNYKFEINPINSELNRFTFTVPVDDIIELTKLDQDKTFLKISDKICFPTSKCQIIKDTIIFDAFPINEIDGDIKLEMFIFSPYESVKHFLNCLFSSGLDGNNDISNYKYVYFVKERFWADWSNVKNENLKAGVDKFNELKSEYKKEKLVLKEKYSNLTERIKYGINQQEYSISHFLTFL